MIIKKPGKYKLLSDFDSRGGVSVLKLPKGTVIEITQIDEQGHRVIGPDLVDWTPWDIDAVRVMTDK